MRTNRNLNRKLLIVLSIVAVLLALSLMLAWAEATQAEAESVAAGGFALSALPESLEVCIPGPAAYNVTAQAMGSFSDPVTLSASGVPAGYNASFNPNPVFPTGNSIMNLTNSGAATAGSYDIDIVGVSPTQTVTTTVKLGLYSATPAAPTLLSPADDALHQPLRPLLEWSAADEATAYFAEVAADAGFSTIVDSATVDGTSYQVSVDLSVDTTYFWRVTPQNACGPGSPSATFSFTTVAAVNSPPVADDDFFAVDENSQDNLLDVLDGDSDADLDPLTISAVGSPDNGGTALNGGTVISYTPAAEFAGSEVFTYTVGDGNGGYDTATVTVTVVPLNEAPLVDAGPDQTISLSSLAVLNGSASDDGLPDPPGVLTTSWSKVSGPGSVTFADPNVLQTTASFSTHGTYLLRLTADDGELGSDDEVTIMVNPIEVFLPLIKR